MTCTRAPDCWDVECSGVGVWAEVEGACRSGDGGVWRAVDCWRGSSMPASRRIEMFRRGESRGLIDRAALGGHR